MSQRFVIFALCLSAPLAALAERSSEPGLMLREGNWGGDAGTYLVPAALRNVSPERWPLDGWNRLTIAKDRVTVAAVEAQPRQRPAFLASIATQVEASRNGSTSREPSSPQSDDIYLRVPGSALVYGGSPAYLFRNGTTTLRPMLDHRYELQLGDDGVRLHGPKRQAGGERHAVRRRSLRHRGRRRELRIPARRKPVARHIRRSRRRPSDGDVAPIPSSASPAATATTRRCCSRRRRSPGMNRATASLASIGC